MALVEKTVSVFTEGAQFMDKDWLRQATDALSAQMGLDNNSFEASLSVEELRDMMRAQGIRPEDNLLSRGIIEAREEKFRDLGL